MKLVGFLVVSAAVALAQSQAEVQLKAATHKQEVEGDLKGAMEAYRQIIAKNGKERGVVAQAMLQLAQCHEKLGQTEARKLYEQIASTYADQADIVVQAQRRLAALDGTSKHTGGLTARQLWKGGEIDTEAFIGPDGKSILLVHWATGDLAVRDIGSGQVKRLHLKTSWNDSSDFAEWPVYSPDQRHIAYAWFSGEDHNYQVRVVSTEPGAKPKVLIRNPEFNYFTMAAWSPDGKFILAGIRRKDGTAQLAWISSADGSVKVLRSLEWRNPQRISLSPDGRHIAYDVWQRQDTADRDIYILAADGASEIALATGPNHEAQPFWTPDGSRIVYLSNSSGRMDLWSVAVSNGKPQGRPQIVRASIGVIEPIGFTRSGSFHYVQETGDQDIFALDMDPATGKALSSAVRMTKSFLGQNNRPAWSPDGKWLAFYSRRGHTRYGPGASSLVVRSLETGEEKAFPWNSFEIPVQQRPVWFHHGLAILEGGFNQQGVRAFRKVDISTGKVELLPLTTPRFRIFALGADDNTVYMPSSDGTSSGVVRFNLSTGQYTTIFPEPPKSRVRQLLLSPDGRQLAMMLDAQQDMYRNRLSVVDVDGRGFRGLAESDLGSIPLLGLGWSPDNRWIYFVRRKQPESQLWRVPVAGGSPEYTGISATDLMHIHQPADGGRLAFTTGRHDNPEHWVLENLLSVAHVSQ